MWTKARCWAIILQKEERKKGEKLDIDYVWFSRKTAVLERTNMISGSISHVDNDGKAWKTWIYTSTELFSVL